ncbi:MAG: curli biogenesis system outer membrane secretion channel CsgG [Flavobacteriales bacterium]|jgi:curli biogenesis system outer membrane secretion channel CsgG
MSLLNRSILLIITVAGALSGCTVTERHNVVETAPVESHRTPYSGEKNNIVVGLFSNKSSYMRGLFSDEEDLLGNQAKNVLKTHLQQTNRFYLLDRDNLQTLSSESEYSGEAQNIEGAKYAIVGGITEFGRRNTSDHQLFGIVGSGKTQIAYTKVMLNVVDVKSTKIVYSSIGAGEYSLNSRQVAGFGTRAGYDSSLNGKVLDLAIREAVNNLVSGLENSEWSLD